MEQKTEPAATETKKIVNPRVEIDTSPPFESVKEAVDRFGGRGPWIPHHLLRLAADHHDTEVLDLDRMEEQATQLERDLIVKEQETLNVLQELEAAKRFVEGLKVSLMQEVSTLVASPDLNGKSTERFSFCPVPSPRSILMDLNQAKSNLSKTTSDLAIIRTSVESLNKKMGKEKVLLQRNREIESPYSAGMLLAQENLSNPAANSDAANIVKAKCGPENSMNISEDLRELNFEAEQFKKMTEASRYEVMKAMSEIERTKTSIRMAEMRLNAARKMEEAAKAVEAIAFAESKAWSSAKNTSENIWQKPEGITLSFEDYTALTQKAQQVEEMCKTKYVDTTHMNATSETYRSEVAAMKMSREATRETKHKKTSLEEAMGNEEGYERRNLVPEDGLCRQTSDHTQTRYSGHKSTKFKFRNSHTSLGNRDSQFLDSNDSNTVKDKTIPFFRSSISIGDVMSRKLILQDDIMLGKHVESHGERQQVSLSQMLREQSGLIFQPSKSATDGNREKQCHSQRKRFGFLHVTLPKQIKKNSRGFAS